MIIVPDKIIENKTEKIVFRIFNHKTREVSWFHFDTKEEAGKAVIKIKLEKISFKEYYWNYHFEKHMKAARKIKKRR